MVNSSQSAFICFSSHFIQLHPGLISLNMTGTWRTVMNCQRNILTTKVDLNWGHFYTVLSPLRCSHFIRRNLSFLLNIRPPSATVCSVTSRWPDQEETTGAPASDPGLLSVTVRLFSSQIFSHIPSSKRDFGVFCCPRSECRTPTAAVKVKDGLQSVFRKEDV